jgi:hypothetical protein
VKSHVPDSFTEESLPEIDERAELLGRMYERAGAHANVITLAGYAALFALWQVNKEVIPTTVGLLVATLTAASVAIFSFHEIYKMIASARHFARLHAALRIVDRTARSEAWREELVTFSLREGRRWHIFLIPTIATGAAAGATLLGAFVWQLTKSF